jgi:hypothetical protein
VQYHIHNPEFQWDFLYQTMEDVKGRFLHLIEEYLITETSLEEVFLAFARAQYPPRDAKISGCKKCMTCSC